MNTLNFGWRKNAGLVHIHLTRKRIPFLSQKRELGTYIDIHFFVQKGHWMWGHSWEEYDMCAEYYAAGPLFLLCLS